jgi:tetratricopeptide (TPR) repeat protein
MGRNTAKARKLLETGIARGTELARQFPQAPILAVHLSVLRGHLGEVEWMAGNSDRGLTLLRTAADECNALLARLPGDGILRAAHFKYNGLLGGLLMQANKGDDALPVLRRAIETARPWVTASEPGPQGDHQSLGQLCGFLGHLLRERKQPAEAVNAYDTGIAAIRSVVERPPAGVPTIPTPAHLLYMLHHVRAEAHEELKQYPAAVADWDEAVRLAPEAERAKVRVRRAMTRIRAGEDATAVNDVEAEVAAGPTGAILYNAACALAIAAGRGGTTADRYAARALELLRKAKAAGFFAGRANREHMRKDEDFAAIRDRAEFKAFVEEVEAGPKK